MDFSEYKELSKLKKEFKKWGYDKRYEKLFELLDEKTIVQIKEIKVYARTNIELLNKISMAFSLLALISSISDDFVIWEFLTFKILILLTGLFYLVFAVFQTKPNLYIEFICNEKLDQLSKDSKKPNT